MIYRDQIKRLTLRQRDILERLATGQSRKEIAAQLDISVYTVDDHSSAMIKKFDCKSKAELIRLAGKFGLAQD